MKTNVPVKKQPVEAMTQSPDIQRRINAGWLRLWKTVYPTTPPPTEVRIPSSEAQPPADQLSAAARRDLGSGDTTSDRSDRSEEHTSELQSLRHLVCRLL